MKKKILSVLLALLIILPACGGPADEPPTTESASIPDLSAQTDKTMGRFHTDAPLAETVLTDEGGVKITATGLTYTEYSVDLDLTIENNSGKDLSLQMTTTTPPTQAPASSRPLSLRPTTTARTIIRIPLPAVPP